MAILRCDPIPSEATAFRSSHRMARRFRRQSERAGIVYDGAVGTVSLQFCDDIWRLPRRFHGRRWRRGHSCATLRTEVAVRVEQTENLRNYIAHCRLHERSGSHVPGHTANEYTHTKWQPSEHKVGATECDTIHFSRWLMNNFPKLCRSRLILPSTACTTAHSTINSHGMHTHTLNSLQFTASTSAGGIGGGSSSGGQQPDILKSTPDHQRKK